MHQVRLGGRFGTERAHRAGLPPVPLLHLRQAIQRGVLALSETRYPVTAAVAQAAPRG
jgi:hypothetical protein